MPSEDMLGTNPHAGTFHTQPGGSTRWVICDGCGQVFLAREDQTCHNDECREAAWRRLRAEKKKRAR